VHVALGTSSLISAFSDCGVNGTSGNCEDASGKSFMMFSAFNNGISYDLPDYNASQTQTVYNSAWFSFLNSGYDWVASYVKNGVTYQGVLNQCKQASQSDGSFRDFSKRVKFFAAGNMVTIGNTFDVSPKNYNSNTCNTYTDGPYLDPITKNNSKYYFCQYNVDGKQGSAATTAQLTIPQGSTIKWAGLYWQALTPHRTTPYSTMTIDIRRDENGTAYKTVPVTHVDYQSEYSDRIYPVGSSKGATSADIYSAFANVTKLFKQQGWLSGDYTVKTSDIMEGRETDFGVYGGWDLIIIYENPNDSYKSFTVFDGWKQVSSSYKENDVPVTVSGFYTPKQTPIKATISIFAGEGDYNNSTDQTFSSYIDTTGNRIPDEYNNNGIDIQQFNVGSTTKYNLLQTRQTSITFHFTSTGDLYFPSVLAFTTDIYAPNICYDYTYGQDGNF